MSQTLRHSLRFKNSQTSFRFLKFSYKKISKLFSTRCTLWRRINHRDEFCIAGGIFGLAPVVLMQCQFLIIVVMKRCILQVENTHAAVGLLYLQHCQERFLRQFELAELFHSFLALFLLFEQFPFAGNVAAVALGNDIFS